MDVSVVIVSWNTRDLLRRCLESVRVTAGSISIEIVVVDNASTDGSAAMVSELFPDVRLIQNEGNRGFASANNQAIRVSQGRYVLLLNSDAILKPGTLQLLKDHLDRDRGAGVVGGQLLNPDGSFQGSFADFPNLLSEMLLLTTVSRIVCPTTFPSYPPERSSVARSVDWIFGACMLVRRSAIDRVGMLDEEYFMYTEETDWCFRMHRAGWHVCYLPEAKIIHWGGQSANAAPEHKRTQLYHSKVLFMRKNRGRVAGSIYLQMVRLVSGLKLAFWAARSVTGDRPKRDFALRNVRSYALLLARG